MPKQSKRSGARKGGKRRSRRGATSSSSSSSRAGAAPSSMMRRLFNLMCCFICGTVLLWFYLFSPLEISVQYHGRKWHLGPTAERAAKGMGGIGIDKSSEFHFGVKGVKDMNVVGSGESTTAAATQPHVAFESHGAAGHGLHKLTRPKGVAAAAAAAAAAEAAAMSPHLVGQTKSNKPPSKPATVAARTPPPTPTVTTSLPPPATTPLPIVDTATTSAPKTTVAKVTAPPKSDDLTPLMLGKDFTTAPPNQPLDPFTRDMLARDDFSELNSADPLVDVSRPIAQWLSAGKKIPILMLSHNRGSLLRKSIVSLTTTVRGATKDNIFIAQDGHNAECLAIAKEFGIRTEIHDNPHVNGPPWKVGAVKIARHYKWAFSKLFDHFSTDAPAVIVVEDDLLYAPDFLDYFHAVAPLVEVDDTLWAASSWNDNGFDYLVKEPHALYRTGFFPGLGWLMTRELWNELQHKWPQEHWDHWLRQQRQHKGREVLFPAMPRVFHNGVKGTFMDRKTHEKYFARIATNRDASVKWRVPTAYGGGSDGSQGEIASGKHMDPWVRAARNLAYEARIERLLTSPATRHVSDPGGEIPSMPAGSSAAIWINIDVSRDHPNPFKPVAQFFGIWHEAKRGAFRGVHEFWANGGETHVLLVNVHPSVKQHKPKGVVHSSFAGYLPSGHRSLPGSYFKGMPPFPRKANVALKAGFHGDEVYNPEKEKRAKRL